METCGLGHLSRTNNFKFNPFSTYQASSSLLQLPAHYKKNDRHLNIIKKKKNLQTINAREFVEKGELSYTVGQNINWYNKYGEQYGVSLKNKNKKLKIVFPGGPVIKNLPENEGDIGSIVSLS